ncbi:hypothetical protein C8R47DRAFT_1081095 [Mycena vitilis]|nr:hypothetical protein C8R47DRAFT_1081095 [Mycena vitilis]
MSKLHCQVLHETSTWSECSQSTYIHTVLLLVLLTVPPQNISALAPNRFGRAARPFTGLGSDAIGHGVSLPSGYHHHGHRPLPLAFPPAHSKYDTGLTPYEIECAELHAMAAGILIYNVSGNSAESDAMHKHACVWPRSAHNSSSDPPRSRLLRLHVTRSTRPHIVKKIVKILQKGPGRGAAGLYYNRYGPELFLSYEQGQRERARRARAKRRAQAGLGHRT